MTVSLDQLEAFIKSVGFPIAVTACVFYALWRCGGFLGREAIIPLVKKIVEFLENLMGCQLRITEASEKMCGQMTDISETQKQHGELLHQITGKHVG